MMMMSDDEEEEEHVGRGRKLSLKKQAPKKSLDSQTI